MANIDVAPDLTLTLLSLHWETRETGYLLPVIVLSTGVQNAALSPKS
jgi:hypothetical protein